MVQLWAGSHDLPWSDRTLGPQVPVLTTVTLSESGSEDNEDDLDEIKGVTSFTVYFSSNFFPVI